MAFSVPDQIWTWYYEIADWFIDDDHIGQNCTIVYPPKREECNNCYVPVGGGRSVYRHGGPAPFGFGNCPLCGGSSFKETEVTGEVRLRIYHDPKDWTRIADTVRVADAEAMIIGYLADLPNIRMANEIHLIDDQTHQVWKFTLAGEPFPHGFGKNRYFMGFLKRI